MITCILILAALVFLVAIDADEHGRPDAAP